jgi:FAD:protein FMN transferase
LTNCLNLQYGALTMNRGTLFSQRKFWAGGMLLLIVVVGVVIVLARQRTPQIVSQSRLLLDTVFDITVVATDETAAARIIAAAYGEVQRLDSVLSRYQETSQIAAVNRQAGQETMVPVAPEVSALVRRSVAYAELTNGVFDVTVGPLVDLWGIGTDHEHVPTTAELRPVLQRMGYQAVEVADAGLRLKNPDMSLDLGGIAKGYIVDQTVAFLQRAGVQQMMVNAGGNIRCVGPKPDGTPWRIGIQHPREKGEILGVIALQGASVATSGDYERVFFQDNVRYHHILDPRTGLQARDCQSVTILAKTAEQADAFSTAVFVMGPDEGLAFLERQPDVEGLIVRADGTIVASSGFAYSKIP